ncbi:hypothetical protein PVAND_014605 [Polypedilum vanderplanki]|uniref:Uncharacterized protein n=1 Tax=Polypedilum vanderplanki TaxID=319348 RepID=A0A9J6BAP2_POLVA|nr:hypothetical protein PVAND_014605 [Polypedilum vanderplanki]
MKIFQIFLLTFSIFSSLSKSIRNVDRNFLLLINQKFSYFQDQYLDDEYYKPDAEYLRSADKKCVYNKLNLVDTDEISYDDLKNFDAKLVFGELEEDYNTLAIYVMYLCIEDVDGFTRHYFNRVIDKPYHKIPKESTECAKNELAKIKKEKPLMENFQGLENHTQVQCDEILFDLKAVNESWDSDFEGCLKIYDEHSLEYSLKFAIMNNERPSDEIFEKELKKYKKESSEICEKFVNCLVEKLL